MSAVEVTGTPAFDRTRGVGEDRFKAIPLDPGGLLVEELADGAPDDLVAAWREAEAGRLFDKPIAKRDYGGRVRRVSFVLYRYLRMFPSESREILRLALRYVREAQETAIERHIQREQAEFGGNVVETPLGHVNVATRAREFVDAVQSHFGRCPFAVLNSSGQEPYIQAFMYYEFVYEAARLASSDPTFRVPVSSRFYRYAMCGPRLQLAAEAAAGAAIAPKVAEAVAGRPYWRKRKLTSPATAGSAFSRSVIRWARLREALETTPGREAVLERWIDFCTADETVHRARAGVSSACRLLALALESRYPGLGRVLADENPLSYKAWLLTLRRFDPQAERDALWVMTVMRQPVHAIPALVDYLGRVGVPEDTVAPDAVPTRRRGLARMSRRRFWAEIAAQQDNKKPRHLESGAA